MIAAISGAGADAERLNKPDGELGIATAATASKAREDNEDSMMVWYHGRVVSNECGMTKSQVNAK